MSINASGDALGKPAGESSDHPGELLLVFCTFPNLEDAGLIAQILVTESLCACVNIVREVRSIYKWKGEVVNNTEVLCLLKTQRTRHAALLARLAELHPYEVPEMVTLAASHVNEPYLNWVVAETAENGASPTQTDDT